MFRKGVYLSIFNGFGSYSQNHFEINKMNKKIIITQDCEIAILRKDEFITEEVLGGEGVVRGYITKKELKEIIKKVRNYARQI